MAKKVPIGRLADEIRKILDEYQDDVLGLSNEAVQKTVKAGVKALKAESKSKFGGKGKYAAGWTSYFETGRVSAQGVIYNAATPGLPHLLEYGHANRGGGFTPGRPHIAPIEEKIIQEFEQNLRSEL